MTTASDVTCLFCRIVERDVASNIVFEDESVMAFMDTSPVTPGHVLVVPRHHAAGLLDLHPQTGAHIFQTGHRLANAMRRTALRCEGVNLFLADGEAAFQEIFHVHLHVFPRYQGDTFRIDADWQVRTLEDLEESAVQIRSGLEALGPSA